MSITTRIRWAGHVSRMGKERKVYRVLVGKPKGNRPLGRPRRKWMGSDCSLGRMAGGVEWIQLAQDRDRWQALVNMVMNCWFWRHELVLLLHKISVPYIKLHLCCSHLTSSHGCHVGIMMFTPSLHEHSSIASNVKVTDART
jgi:hypothetical protein